MISFVNLVERRVLADPQTEGLKKDAKEMEKIFKGLVSRKFPNDIQSRAFNKLAAIHVSLILDDLKSPPSNHLEQLKGDRADQYSVRINKKYRICFEWYDNNACNVEIVDYHD